MHPWTKKYTAVPYLSTMVTWYGSWGWCVCGVQQLKQGTENGFKPWECFLTCITQTLFSCNLTLEVEWDGDAVPFSVLSCSSHPLAPSFSNNTPSPILCRCWWAKTMRRPSRTLWKTYFLCAITMTTICLSLKEDLSISQQASGMSHPVMPPKHPLPKSMRRASETQPQHQ